MGGTTVTSSKRARSSANPRAIRLPIVTCTEASPANAVSHHLHHPHHRAIRLRSATVVRALVTIAAIHHLPLAIRIRIVTLTPALPAAPTQNATRSVTMPLEARKEERKEGTTVVSTTVPLLDLLALPSRAPIVTGN